MSFKTWMIDLKKNKVKDSKASSLSLWRVFGFTLTEFQRKIQTHISWSVIWIHLIFQNLSKSVQQNTSCFQPGVGRAKWAGEAPKYMHNSTANFWWTKQNPNLTIYAKLCSNHITHVHGKSSKTVLKHQGNTTLSGNMQTYTQSPTFGQVLKGSILKAVCLSGQIHSARTESELFGNWFVGTQKLDKFQRCICILILPIRHRSQAIRLKMLKCHEKIVAFMQGDVTSFPIGACKTANQTRSQWQWPSLEPNSMVFFRSNLRSDAPWHFLGTGRSFGHWQVLYQ